MEYSWLKVFSSNVPKTMFYLDMVNIIKLYKKDKE